MLSATTIVTAPEGHRKLAGGEAARPMPPEIVARSVCAPAGARDASPPVLASLRRATFDGRVPPDAPAGALMFVVFRTWGTGRAALPPANVHSPSGAFYPI
jgi:hypothetical protein